MGWTNSKPWIWAWVLELVSLVAFFYLHHQSKLSSTDHLEARSALLLSCPQGISSTPMPSKPVPMFCSVHIVGRCVLGVRGGAGWHSSKCCSQEGTGPALLRSSSLGSLPICLYHKGQIYPATRLRFRAHSLALINLGPHIPTTAGGKGQGREASPTCPLASK